ncbi:MAG: hypothetical protein ACM3U2_13310 [Deltaproteobacteria bacterium]
MKSRLLATDPDPLLRGIYRAYFPHFGFEVVTAGDGLECVGLLREFAPDALILSLELLWGGGDGVLSFVREQSQLQPIAVVLTTDGLSLAKATKHLVPPVVRLLEKPLRLRDLRAGVEAALHGKLVRAIVRAADEAASRDGADVLGVTRSALTYRPETEEIRHV